MKYTNNHKRQFADTIKGSIGALQSRNDRKPFTEIFIILIK